MLRKLIPLENISVFIASTVISLFPALQQHQAERAKLSEDGLPEDDLTESANAALTVRQLPALAESDSPWRTASRIAGARAAVNKPVFDLAGFQEADGAIPVFYEGKVVDPYFAIKALLTAHDAGFNIEDAAQRFIDWLLPHQEADGRFGRYTRKTSPEDADQVWVRSRDADADDALLALWIELLHVVAPGGKLPPEWKRSLDLAERHLATLRNSRGVYVISRENPVALLMDNVEIYGALRTVARRHKQHGRLHEAGKIALRAAALRMAIYRVFWDRQELKFRVSTQDLKGDDFYPFAAAQLFPPMEELATPKISNVVLFESWLRQHQPAWFKMPERDYPWGLVAFLAWKMGYDDVALEWQSRTSEHRFGPRWPVLDEAVFHIVENSEQLARTPGAKAAHARSKPIDGRPGTMSRLASRFIRQAPPGQNG